MATAHHAASENPACRPCEATVDPRKPRPNASASVRGTQAPQYPRRSIPTRCHHARPHPVSPCPRRLAHSPVGARAAKTCPKAVPSLVFGLDRLCIDVLERYVVAQIEEASSFSSASACSRVTPSIRMSMSRVARAPMVRASMLCPLWGEESLGC